MWDATSENLVFEALHLDWKSLRMNHMTQPLRGEWTWQTPLLDVYLCVISFDPNKSEVFTWDCHLQIDITTEFAFSIIALLTLPYVLAG